MDLSEQTQDLIDSIKSPPYSLEAEQSVLGGLMLDNQAWDTVSEILVDSHFYRPDHRALYRAIQKLVDENRPFDVVTLSEELDRSGELDRAGGLEYLVELARNTPSTSNIRAYAEIVRDRALLRQMIQVANEIAENAYQPQGRASEEILNEAEQKIFQIAENRPNQGGPEPISPLLKRAVERIDHLFNNADALTGVTTGFDDLDARTGGLQPSDLIIVAARPSMGKCIVSGSLLVDPITGARTTIDEMVKHQKEDVLSLNDHFKIERRKASAFVDDGLKPVYRVRTALGRTIETTLTHPFLTAYGWQPLAKINLNDLVAVPRELPVFGNHTLAEYKLKTLAYFLGDGGTTQSSPIFTNTNPRIMDDFTTAVERFGAINVSRTEFSDRTPSYRVAGRSLHPALIRKAFADLFNQAIRVAGFTGKQLAAQLGTAASTISQWRNAVAVPSPRLYDELCAALGAEFKVASKPLFESASTLFNPVTQFLKQNQLWGKLSYEKAIPEVVFELPQQQMALFLNRLFACDGGIYISNTGQVRVTYGSASEVLAEQVQHLLLRFGVLAKRREKNHHERVQYEIEVLDQTSVKRFCTEIGIFGKEAKVLEAQCILKDRRTHSNLDALPETAIDYLLSLKSERSWSEIFAAKGLTLPEGYNPHLSGKSRRQLSRQRAAEFAQLLGDQYLADLSASDIYWDKVIAIEYQGYKQVYDLTVPELHNFVAQDFFVHNTTFAMNLVENALMGTQRPVLVFSLEMPADQLVTRMLSSLGKIDQTRVRNGQLLEEDWPKLTTAVNMLKGKPLFIDDTAGISPNEMRSRARRIVREQGDLAMIMVDYLQLMQLKTGKSEGRTAEISEISRSLKALAKEMQCPVVALSQLNRSLENRPNKRPVNSDLRESGAIEQDADVIMFIYRDEVYNEDSPEKGVAEIIIGKQRNGPIGTSRLAFIGKYTRFENLSHIHYDYMDE